MSVAAAICEALAGTLCNGCQLALDELCGGSANVKACGSFEPIHNTPMQEGINGESDEGNQ